MTDAAASVAGPTLESLASALWSAANGLPARLLSAANSAAGAAAEVAGMPAGAAAGAVTVARRSTAGALVTGLAVLGTAALLSWGASAVDFVLPNLRPSRLRRFNHGGLRKPWAVVAGATDGIGKGFALELAAACFDVVLIASDKNKLATVAQEIQHEFPGTQTRLLVAVASNVDQARFLAELEATVTALPGPITVLVNNVNTAAAGQEVFVQQDDQDISNQIIANNLFPTLVTKHLLPTLEKNQPSLILNVGSCASDLAVPYRSVYSGTKAYNAVWSESVYNELLAEKVNEVECQYLLAGDVRSNSNQGHVGLFYPDARKFARSALRVSTRRPAATPYLPHALIVSLARHLPSFAYRWGMRRMMRRSQEPVPKYYV